MGVETKPVLAIVTQHLTLPSETFIRDHIRNIAPDRTVVICQVDDGAGQLDCPVLCVPQKTAPAGRVRRRIVSQAKHYWSTFVRDGLPVDQETAVTAFLRQHDVDAVLVEYLNRGVLFLNACRRANARVYVHAHGVDATAWPRKPGWTQRYQRIFAGADGIIAPSRYIADRLVALGCPARKLHVAPCGVDPAQFTPSSRLAGRVLMVGRMVEKKAPHLAIRAFAEAARTCAAAHLDVVGDGPLMERCRATIAEQNISDKVTLHGAQPHAIVRRLMGQASVLLQHSVTASDGNMEGLPVAILEAMASGVPVVATRHSGIPEAVIDGETGILVDEHDVEGMASAVRALLENPASARSKGDAGRAWFLERFTQAHASERLRQIMQVSSA